MKERKKLMHVRGKRGEQILWRPQLPNFAPPPPNGIGDECQCLACEFACCVVLKRDCATCVKIPIGECKAFSVGVEAE